MISASRLDTASDWLIANLGTMKKSDVLKRKNYKSSNKSFLTEENDSDGKLSQKYFLRSSCPQQKCRRLSKRDSARYLVSSGQMPSQTKTCG